MAEKCYAGMSFEEVVRKYSDTVTGVCLMRLKNMSDVEDCYQNTFLKFYTKSPKFEDEQHIKAWLIRVAIRECASYMRKNRRQVPVESFFDESDSDNKDNLDISWALIKTPSKYRDVLYLHYCEEYKVKEIAQIIGAKENTVKSLLRRGREILRKIYGGDDA
ncbi:MAG TPA: RNA polymerase subunit sigma-70 [Ruminococcus sp.]|nr:RNA polymerase subunit sigma-70 [Ruminococcus sp.]